MASPPLYVLTIQISSKNAEAFGGLLVELGAGAVEERPLGRNATLCVYGPKSRLSALASKAAPLFAGFGITERAVAIERAPAIDWLAPITTQARPQRLTRRFRVVPVMDGAEHTPSQSTIAIRPGLAFGDGAHPTTRLAARAIETLSRKRRVLDVGSGSGVLSFVAALSGATRVDGVEIDRTALALAKQNARLNRLRCPVRFVRAFPGPRTRFDLVVANLEPRILLEQAASLARAAERARWLVVTGFLSEQAAGIAARFEREGFRVSARAREKGWGLLRLEVVGARRGSASAGGFGR
jgi:ribosomal protein L11 methylase PrmA